MRNSSNPLFYLVRLLVLAIFLVLSLCICAAASASTLTLPDDLKVIDEEAFYGDTSLDVVVLPEGIESIGSRAFAESSLTEIYLPDSLENIAYDAFDLNAGILVRAAVGSKAYNWALEHGFITDPNADNFDYISHGDGTCTITGYNKDPYGELRIPSRNPDGELVTEIGANAFDGCSGFTGSLTIPDSVTTIGNLAFNDCSGFTGSLTIGERVNTIGDMAFYNCSGFTGDLKIPDGVITIGNFAFSVTPPDAETTDEEFYTSAYGGFTGNLTIGKNVTTIGSGAFAFCNGFRGSLTIPNSVTIIGDFAFTACTGFTGRLTIGNSVTTIADYAFYCCGFTGNLNIPDNVTMIGEYAFSECIGFNGTLTIGKRVTTIGGHAFTHCTGFTGGLKIPDNVVTIGDYAFALAVPGDEAYSDSIWIQEINLGGFNSLTIGKKVTTIGDLAFSGCSNFSGNLTIPDSVKTIGFAAFFGCWGFTGNLTLGNGLTSIGDYAFTYCRGFTGSLIIPDSVTMIGNWVFDLCDGFKRLIIPDSVTTIGNCAFLSCSGFTGSLNIPDSVTTIGESAFSDCRGFTGSLNIPESVITMGDYAFSYCRGFTGSLNIPDSVTTIGDHAFCDCSGFTGFLNIPDSVITIGDFAFSGCDGFTGSLNIPNSVTTIGNSAFNACSGFTGSLSIPDSVTTIGDSAFLCCSGFTGSLNIPNSVTTIGNSAFSACSGFTGSLNIPDSVTTIGDYAFSDCNGFTGSLNIPDSVTTIGNGAFSYCRGFTGSLNIPDSVITIGNSAFYNCSGFTGSLNIPDSVTTIGNSAFLSCSGFTGSLTIPNSATTIGDSAFNMCWNLEKTTLTITDSDGTSFEVSRTAVYCGRNSYAWEWAESDPDYEPIEWDGNYASLPEKAQLNGTFSDDSIVVTIGAPNIIPAGRVFSLGNDIYRVTITVTGYEMDDPVNNRYATDVFIDHHIKEVNLQDWEAFYIDTTREPFNMPGEYTINLWANVMEGEGVKLDSMIVNVVDKLSSPIITYPAADNDEVPYGDIRVTWDQVPGAGYYVVSLRELDTDELLIFHEKVEETETTLSTAYFWAGMQYRVAVGAVPAGMESTSSAVGWKERVFTVSEQDTEDETRITGTVYQYLNDGTDAEETVANREVNLFQINKNGNEEEEMTYIGSTITDEEGSFEFSEIESNQSYFLTVSQAVVRMTRSAGSENFNTSSSIDTVSGTNTTDLYINLLTKDMGGNGLTAEYFQYDGWNKNDIYSDENVRWYGTVPNIDFSFKGEKEYNGLYDVVKVNTFSGETSPVEDIRYVSAKFGARFNGVIKVPVSAYYQFRLIGDDGVELTINSRNAKKWGSGSRNIALIGDKKAELVLNEGIQNDIEIQYYNDSKNGNLILEYRAHSFEETQWPSKEEGWETVPASWLFQGNRKYTNYDGWLNHADDIEKVDTKLKKYVNGTAIVNDIIDATIMPWFDENVFKSDASDNKGFIKKYGIKALKFFGKSMMKALYKSAVEVMISRNSSLPTIVGDDFGSVWDDVRDAILEDFHLKCERDNTDPYQVDSNSKVREVIYMDWPSDWHEQLNLTMKCLDIVKQFGTSEMKSYVEEETSAIMQFFYYIDFDYYKAEDDYYGNEVYDTLHDAAFSFAGTVKPIKIVKNIYDLVKNAADSIKKNKDSNHIRSTIMLTCMDAANKFVPGQSSTLFSQEIPKYMKDTLMTSPKIVNYIGVDQDNYTLLLNSMNNSSLIANFAYYVDWDTGYGNWEGLLYKQLLLDVISCAKTTYPMSDLKNLFK